jgi:hypothetical protein
MASKRVAKKETEQPSNPVAKKEIEKLGAILDHSFVNFLYFLLTCFCKKSPPPLCDFMQWLDIEQSDDNKSCVQSTTHATREGGSA